MRKLVAVVICFASVGLATAPAMATDATANHASYAWVIGAIPPPTPPADTAMAPDGSTITLIGHGRLTAGPGSTASGGGTFTTGAGGSGTFTATAVQGFVSYGPAGSLFPPGFTGGEAKLSVALSNGQTGLLTITCVLGSPPGGKMEGIQLVLGSGVSGEYTKSVEGNNVFIAL